MLSLSQEGVAGVDEAGRGPLAGPVFAAAVILDPLHPIQGLADSKVLTEKKRLHLFDEIRMKALAFSIAEASIEEIAELNILYASLLAMQRAVAGLTCVPSLVLVDGNQAPRIPYPVKTIIDGDKLEPAISAASILAKVARDQVMVELDALYPQYGFAKHKGYGTKAHLEALQTFGVCPIHRLGYAPVAKMLKLSGEIV